MLFQKNPWFLISSVFLLTLNIASLFAEPREVIVSAAASLKNVMETIGRKFEEENPGTKIIFNFGASGALLNQIIGGAPVDLLFSADIKDFQKLGEWKKKFMGIQTRLKTMLAPGYPKPFLRNELVLIIPGASRLTLQKLADLKKSEWKKIAIGNPKTVPAGRYAEETLNSESLSEDLKDRLVLCENVRQVLDYVIRGEVEAGFVYVTDAKTAKPGEVNTAMAVPPEQHSPIIYGLGKLSAAQNPEMAEKFLEYVNQPPSREVFSNAGFIPEQAGK